MNLSRGNIMNIKERLLQRFENSELLQSYYQNQVDRLYWISWRTLSINKNDCKFTLEKLQKQLQKNKTWFLSYLDFYKWDNGMFEKARTCETIATYLAYDTTLSPLEKLHFAKYYCERNTDQCTMINKMAFTKIAVESYLQNSLYESGKSSYVKK